MFRKKTLRVKLALLVIVILLLVVLFGLLISNIFLSYFYMQNKRDSLVKAFQSIDAEYVSGLENSGSVSGNTQAETSDEQTPESDSSSDSASAPAFSANIPPAGESTGGSENSPNSESKAEEPDKGKSAIFQNSTAGSSGTSDSEDLVVSDNLQLDIDKISTNKSLSILIYRTVNRSQDLYGFIITHNTNELLYSSLGMGQDSKLNNDKIYADYVYSKNSSANDITAGTYRIKQIDIERVDSSYLYLEGRLPNNDKILIRASVASIKESVYLANSFFFYILIFAAIFGFILTYFVTGKFLNPISELKMMAKRMSELDFTAKYDVKTEDEIGDLGNSINILSESLEKAIGELKDANTQLRQDLEQKEKIDEMRKEFLSNVSHELKTPIALIQGYAEGLLDNVNEDEESRQFYCEVIVDEAKKMNGMVKQIMSLNQLEFGYSHVNIEYFDVTELIRSVISRSDILIKEKEANLVFEQTEPVYVWSDSFMTDEVFTNYFTNALNHLAGEKRIVITLTREADIVRISVFNNGDNIPDEDIDRIWDKFYKVDKARTREYGGSGVGLSIVKAIMNLLGQKYGVRNEKDGVLFWFELDCSDTNKNEAEEADL